MVNFICTKKCCSPDLCHLKHNILFMEASFPANKLKRKEEGKRSGNVNVELLIHS